MINLFYSWVSVSVSRVYYRVKCLSGGPYPQCAPQFPFVGLPAKRNENLYRASLCQRWTINNSWVHYVLDSGEAFILVRTKKCPHKVKKLQVFMIWWGNLVPTVQ